MSETNQEGKLSKQEETYFNELREYLNENDEQYSERTFVEKKISDTKLELNEIKNKSDADIINNIRAKDPYSDFRNHMTEDQYEKGLLNALKHYKTLIPDRINEYEWKLAFYKLKLNRIIPITITKKISKSLMLNGKQLNLNERFKIADHVFGINEKFGLLNINEIEKYKLLAIILGCNETNARHLMNGIYKADIRKGLVNEYLDTLL